MKQIKEFFSRMHDYVVGERLVDFHRLIGDLGVILTMIFMTVGWTANIVKIFLADTYGEIIWRITSAIIFPIGAFYGYL